MFRHGIGSSEGGRMVTTCGIPIENNANNPTSRSIVDAMMDDTLPMCADCDRILAKALGFTDEQIEAHQRSKEA